MPDILRLCRFLAALMICLEAGVAVYAQEPVMPTDSSANDRFQDDSRYYPYADSTLDEQYLDSAFYYLYPDDIYAADSVVTDTLKLEGGPASRTKLEAEVKYASKDSLSISVGAQKIFLYKDASVEYQDFSILSNYIEFDLNTNTSIAYGMPDSAGVTAGKPSFTQGGQTIDSDTMRYNFDSQKAIIKQIITQEGEGYLHSETTKRLADGEIHINKGKYTTCDLDHPHFYVQLTRAIAMPEEKIVSGPFYMVVGDIPLPLALPFGFFPNTDDRSSGLIIPQYGEEKTRGFFLRNGGWYFVFNDYVDLTLLGTMYSRGTWGLTASSVYRLRYKFSGRFNVDFYSNNVNDDPTFTSSRDLRISWNHTQDAKANPSRKFSANVNFSTMSYDRNHSYNVNDYITNTKSSSISYSKNWPGSPFNLTANMNLTQNSQTSMINMTLPNITFNMSRQYPFRGKNTTGDYNWFQNIQVSYSAKLENRVNAPDSTFFTSATLQKMKNGFYHSIPISLTNIKILNDYINISPSINYSGMLYTSYQEQRPYSDSTIFDQKEVYDTIHKVTYAHSFSASLGISTSPKLYGEIRSKKTDSYISVIRHVMTPSASFSFAPDMSSIMPDYYRKAVNPGTITKPSQTREYSIYRDNIYGTPVAQGRSGSVSFGLNNNFEMKVRPRNDSTGSLKKVILLKTLNFKMSYSPFAPSFKWSTMNMAGSTDIFDQQMNVTFGATFDPYSLDSTGRKVDKYLIRDKGRLFRTTYAYLTLRFRLESRNTTVEPGEEQTVVADDLTETTTVLTPLNESIGYFGADYVDFNVPWSLNVDYNWSYSRQSLKASYNHTVRLSGDISLTPKWKIGVNSGFDFVSRKITMTNISIYRDLHCWDMRFSVIPFGDRKSYTFTISAKSSILRDVKYNKSRSWQDNF